MQVATVPPIRRELIFVLLPVIPVVTSSGNNVKPYIHWDAVPSLVINTQLPIFLFIYIKTDFKTISAWAPYLSFPLFMLATSLIAVTG